MGNIEILNDEPYFSEGLIKAAVYNTVHTTKYWQHSHRFFEFVYVVDGFSLHSHNNRTAILSAGDLFAISPGDVHAYTVAHNTNIYNVIFYPEELGEFCDELRRLPGLNLDSPSERDSMLPIVNVDLSMRHELISLLERMRVERVERRQGWELNIKAMLTSFLVFYSRLLTEANRSASKYGDSRGYSGYICSALRYIEDNYETPIDSADIAAAAGISTDYLAKQFKTVMGMTPAEYLRRYRLTKAMDLLKSTELSVSEIAECTGFGDISLFSRIFKQTIGKSPMSFRKEQL